MPSYVCMLKNPLARLNIWDSSQRLDVIRTCFVHHPSMVVSYIYRTYKVYLPLYTYLHVPLMHKHHEAIILQNQNHAIINNPPKYPASKVLSQHFHHIRIWPQGQVRCSHVIGTRSQTKASASSGHFCFTHWKSMRVISTTSRVYSWVQRCSQSHWFTWPSPKATSCSGTWLAWPAGPLRLWQTWNKRRSEP